PTGCGGIGGAQRAPAREHRTGPRLLIVHADQRDANALRRPAEVEADGHPFSQAVDTRDRADDLDEGKLEAILAAGGLAAQRPAVAAVVDAADDAPVVPIGNRFRRGRLIAFRSVAGHAAGVPPPRSAAPAAACRCGAPTRSTNAAKLSPACRSRS